MKRKQAKTDFTRDGLPKNRWEVFTDCLKVRFLLFFYMGIVLFISALPLLFVTVMSDNTAGGLYESYVNAEFTEQKYYALSESANSLYAMLFIPCYIILAIGVAGVTAVIRRLVWGEGVFFMQDLFEGIKSNGLYYALIAALLGTAAYLQITFLPVGRNGYYVILPVVFSLLVLPPSLFMISQMTIYKNTFLKYFTNGFVLYIKSFPSTLAFFVLFLIPAALGLNLIPILVKYIILVVFFLIPAPMLLVGWFIYSCYVFDKFVNKRQYPEIYDKGVYRKTETE